MPEVPEIEFLRRRLKKELINYKVGKINFLNGPGYKNTPPLFKDFKKIIVNTKINDLIFTHITRKGKYLSLEIQDLNNKDNTWWICNNFGLHGIYRLDDNILVPNYDSGKKNLHINIEFEKDGITKNLQFFDTTGFGTNFKFFNNLDNYIKFLDTLAIDIFDEDFTLDAFKKNLAIMQDYKKNYPGNTSVSYFLTRQNYLCSGIGNYLKCEILYDAKISPNRSIIKLSDEETENLFNSIIKVSDFHFEKGGRLLDNMKVYKKKKDPNDFEVVYEKTSDNKKTYWVPEIQK
tara:strand:- start:651 stop:1520 length:870 start_codon:yes stop_codon:yes gene_type:complete